jgi:hypothetical protein
MAYRHRLFLSLWVLLVFFLLWGCRKGARDTSKTDRLMDEAVDTTGLLLRYHNNLFSIPSPYQAAYIIQQHDVNFSRALLNDPELYGQYTTSFKKALNLGVYGTDLGYLNIFNRDQELQGYFNAFRSLAEDLGLSNAVAPAELESVKNRLMNGDSAVFHLSRTYRKFDAYLREHNRQKLGALVLAGGWIESNYILSQIVLESNQRQLINRLGEQKYVLENLIDLLSSYYYEASRYTELVDALVDIAYQYDGVIYNYYYKKPVVKEEQKLTIIRSTSNVVISEYHIQTISKKLSELRNKIVS